MSYDLLVGPQYFRSPMLCKTLLHGWYACDSLFTVKVAALLLCCTACLFLHVFWWLSTDSSCVMLGWRVVRLCCCDDGLHFQTVVCNSRTDLSLVFRCNLQCPSRGYCYLTLSSPLVCTTSLTFNNSTFCSHSVYVCFVWIWKQTAIISLYSINWLVFITETECVYCAVRTGTLYTIQTPLKPSDHYMYHQFNIQQFHVLPTQCIYVFYVDLRTNSDYFPIQH